MTITKNLLTSAGAKKAEDQLLQELNKKYESDVKRYCALSQLEKITKRAKKAIITPTKVETLRKDNQEAVDAQKHFYVDGIRCFIRARKTYNFDDDAEYKRLLKDFEKAQTALENRKQEMIEAGTASVKTTYIFECHGED